MTAFVEDFNRPDGDIGSPWNNSSGLGGTNPILKIVSNRGASLGSSTAIFDTYALHGLNLTGTTWQIDCDCNAPLIVGNGGVTVGLIDSGGGGGYGFFCGNAVHVQRFLVGGGFDHPTNVGRPGEGNAGLLFSHITMTHASNGDISMYLDGQAWGAVNDTTVSASGDILYVSAFNTTSPTDETTLDNLVVSNSITGVPVFASGPQLVMNRYAQQRAGRW
jgi:hypothetical protein